MGGECSCKYSQGSRVQKLNYHAWLQGSRDENSVQSVPIARIEASSVSAPGGARSPGATPFVAAKLMLPPAYANASDSLSKQGVIRSSRFIAGG